MAGHDTTGSNIEISLEQNDSRDISEGILNELQKIVGEEEVSNWSALDVGIIVDELLGYQSHAILAKSIGPWLVLEGKDTITSIHLLHFWGGDRENSVEEISFDEAQARYIESISHFKEQVLDISQLSVQINLALDRNDDTIWEVIDEEDTITEGPLTGKTIVEAILIYRRKIIESGRSLRNLGIIDKISFPEVVIAREELYDSNEEYLLLILGIGEKREELTHVIPKSQDECILLITGIVDRRNPREILDWMKNIHRQIDDNNWQDGTVEKNYLFFIKNLNTLVLEKLRREVFDNQESNYYQDASIFLEFAVLVSGRSAWNKESFPFMEDGLVLFQEQSPVDSRLWMREPAEQALSYAMDVPIQNENGESQNMISQMMPHLNISDSLLEGKNPNILVLDTIDLIKDSVYQTDKSGNETSISGLADSEFDTFLETLGYKKIVEKSKKNTLGNTYQELTLEEMINISALIRIFHALREITPHMGVERYIPQEGEELIDQREIQTVFGPNQFLTRTVTKKRVSFDDFGKIAQSAVQDSVKHVGDELDKNFDDSWGQVWENRWMDDEDGDGNITNEVNKARAGRFGINNDINSIEYQIFTLFNDINGNGEVGEFSDTTQGVIKTAGFMLAMVAGSILLGGSIIIPSLLRAGITIESMAAQGAIMGMTGSALGYGFDAVVGDARGFYTPGEAIIGVGSDFILGASTGALSGPLASALPKIPDKAIFGIDLTLLGLGPEFLRMYTVNQAWHGSEIFTQGGVVGKINDIRRGFLSYEGSDEQVTLYLENPYSEELSPNLKDYRFFLREFGLHGFTPEDISMVFDIRFQEAYATWKILNPGNHLNVWQVEPEFLQANQENRENRSGGRTAWKGRILDAAEQWIQRQETRLGQISG